MNDQMADEPQPPEAELTRLADGSVPRSRQAELRARTGSQPGLTRALAEQERAVAMLRSLDVAAPDSLRERVEQLTEAPPARPLRRVWRRPGRLPRLPRGRRLIAPAGLAVAVAVAVFLLTVAGTTGPTLGQTVAVALAPTTLPAPAEAADAGTLTTTAAGVAFPYWERTVGWRALGSRIDRLSGRLVKTVFYGDPGGDRVGYAIVEGPPVPAGGGASTVRNGVSFTLLREGAANVVTWLRSGHTCVIAGQRTSQRTLLRLATAA